MHRLSYQRGGGGVRWPLVWATVIAALAVLGTGIWLLVRANGPLLGDDAPEFSFTVRRVKAVGPAGRGDPEALRPVAEDLSSTLNDLYLAGFVDPGQWQEGTFPAALEAFAPPAASGARRDLADLTLGPDSARLERVEPSRGVLTVEFLMGEEGEPFAAVAVTRFEATGVMPGGSPVPIEHSGRYLMRPLEGRWLIIGYRVTGALGREPAP